MFPLWIELEKRVNTQQKKSAIYADCFAVLLLYFSFSILPWLLPAAAIPATSRLFSYKDRR